jgi:hypothetical protein
LPSPRGSQYIGSCIQRNLDCCSIAQLARRLLADVDTSAGVRLFGVGVTALADFVQDDLFGDGGTEVLRPPIELMRATGVPQLPAAQMCRGGCAYEIKWDGSPETRLCLS